jgi:hypothetical protein
MPARARAALYHRVSTVDQNPRDVSGDAVPDVDGISEIDILALTDVDEKSRVWLSFGPRN